ncbi:hypothetical protein FQA47_007685 [Oryzias melastigma]|uniref:Uncharacterized protein n=1 Tax=Oryzias melastigma TaxID=30732 RepID=A0A834CFE9_ORYME|nr:hypothetical protein FQA47_007685 [Oryzias melastigma]
MSSLQSLRELISERLAAAAEEICRLCEGTIVQYEQELCRQRRLLDICWKPQLQLHHVVCVYSFHEMPSVSAVGSALFKENHLSSLHSPPPITRPGREDIKEVAQPG